MKTYTNHPRKYTLENLLRDTLNGFDEKYVHEFRREMKKLRATMQLIHVTDESFDNKKKYRVIRPFYKNLGDVREIQIQQGILKDNAKTLKASFRKKFQEILTSELLEYKDAALNQFDDAVFKSIKKREKQTKKILKDVSKRDFKDYLTIRTQKLKKAFDSLDFSKEKIHATRMLVKEITFNTRLKKKTAKKWLAKQELDLPLLEDLQEWFGDWHDKQILIERLMEQEGANWLQKGESEALAQFKTKMETESKEIKDKIEKALEIDNR